MEAARGAAALRAQAKRRAQEREDERQSRVLFSAPTRVGDFASWKVRVEDDEGRLTSSKEFYDEAEARDFAETAARFTKHGVLEWDWDEHAYVKKENA